VKNIMNIFIDTNIYLTFYHYSIDDLEELKKLLAALRDPSLTLYLPEQTILEFKRNRESKIADAIKTLSEQKIPDSFPQMCKDYPEYKTLKDSIAAFQDAKAKIMKKLQKDVNEKTLKADQIISELFKSATKIPQSPSIIKSAKDRFDLGNPPGKKGSYGDAINWTSLLEKVPDGEELHIVARDKDYISAIDGTSLSEFLYDEWVDKKRSKVFLYGSLSDFFKQHFPNIKLATELEKRIAINKLVNSGSFASTHKAIERLSSYTDFTDKEVEEITEAAIENDQINSIIQDEDVSRFINYVIRGREKSIHPEKLQKLKNLLHVELEYEDVKDILEENDLPF